MGIISNFKGWKLHQRIEELEAENKKYKEVLEHIATWPDVNMETSNEVRLLEGRPVPFEKCPKCNADFEPFLRGMVQRSPRKWIFFGPRRPYCALICWQCKEIVGYE